jgi:hypothetical protein
VTPDKYAFFVVKDIGVMRNKGLQEWFKSGLAGWEIFKPFRS